MFKPVKLFTALLMTLLIITVGCSPCITTTEYERVKSELAQTKVELEKAQDNINKTKSASAEMTGGVIKSQSDYFEELLKKRRSIRDFANTPLTKNEVIKLLWAAQGITGEGGLRTAPSANVEAPPLRIYVVINNVDSLSPGLYKYYPQSNEISQIKAGDMRNDLSNVMGGTGFRGSPFIAIRSAAIRGAAINIIIMGIYKDTIDKYTPFFGAERGYRYVLLEAGHATQNILLMATALNLGATPMGGCNDDSLRNLIGATSSENPLYVVPIGIKK